MQENLAFLQIAKKPNEKKQKITEAILKVQDILNKNNLGVQEKDIDNSLLQIWDFFFTLIKDNSLSIQNSIERCASIFILRNYSFYPEKIEKLLINQIKLRKKYSDEKEKTTEANNTNEKDVKEAAKEVDSHTKSNSKNETIIYDPTLSKYDDLLLQLFTIISPKISSMRIDTFLESCKENGLLSIFSMKGNQTISTTVPKYISNLKCLGIDWHIDLLSSFLSEKVEYSQIKSINAIIDNYPILFRSVLFTDNYSLISFILSIHNNTNDEINSNITNRYFSNLNTFPRTEDLINLLYQSTTVSDIDNFLMILSCDKDVKIKIENKNDGGNEDSQEEEDENDSENDTINIEKKIVEFHSNTNFSRILPLSQVINRSSFYNFADLPFKYLLPRENDSVFILTIKFQKIAQRATIKNCKKIFSIFDHFLNERKSKNDENDEFVNSTPFYDELTSACLQNLPICINVFSVLPEFPVFLKKVLLVKPSSWLHASDISNVLGSLNAVHFSQIGGLTTIISKLIQFSMSTNKQLSNNAIESIVRISNLNNGDMILQTIYNSFDDFDSHNVSVNLRIASKIVEKNGFYFCILTTFLERILEICLIYQDDLFLFSEIMHFVATIKNKTKLPSYSSNSFIVDETKSIDSFKKANSGFGKKLRYLKEIALSLIYAYIQFFVGVSNFHPPQSKYNLVDNLYALLQNYVNSSDFDQINFSFLFNAFDFLIAYPSTNYKTLSLILCDDLINVFPKEVSEFTVKYAQSAVTQAFYKAFDFFSNAKDIEVGAIWCNVYIKIADTSPDNSVSKQLDDKVNPVFEKMADFAFASPTRVSKFCLNIMSLFLLKLCPERLKDLIENLTSSEVKNSTMYFLYKENEAEFNFLFPNAKPIKGTKFRIDGERTKRKSNLSDEYSDDEEEDSEFDHIVDVDSDSFSDKSQQSEFAFKFNKVVYNDLLQIYSETIANNYLIQTQMKYSLVNYTIDQLKVILVDYFESCDYESIFNLIIYCMRFHRDFPFSEYTDQFSLTPFKNLSIFLSKVDKSNNGSQNEIKQKGSPVSVVSLTSAFLMNAHISDENHINKNEKSVYDQFLYYYDRFMLFYDDRVSKYSILKEMKSIDNLSTNTTEYFSSSSTKSQSSRNDRNCLSSSKNNFNIPYLYEENEYDTDSLSHVSPTNFESNIFSPLSTVDNFSYSSINLKVTLVKRILELLSLSSTIEKATKDEKLSKKLFRRILSCIPFVNKSFLAEGIDLLEFSLILVSKVEKPMHWKYSLLVLANVANQMESLYKDDDEEEDINETNEDFTKQTKEKSKSEKNKKEETETTEVKSRNISLTNKPFEKNFTINDSFISSFYSIYNDNNALIPRDEFIICLRAIIEKTICQDESKLHDLLKMINSNQKEYISPSGLNVFISNIHFSIKLENLDVSSLWNKMLSFKGIPSFFIRGCSLIYNVMMKTIRMQNFPQLKNVAQIIFDAKKMFNHSIKDDFEQLTDGSNADIYASSQAQNISLSQTNLKKASQQANPAYNSENNIKYINQTYTCNFFIDKSFYNTIWLILSRSLIQQNITFLLKQYEFILIDPRRAEFNLSSQILPYLIKKINASQQQAVKKIQMYVSSFILPKHIANVSEIKQQEEISETTEKIENTSIVNPSNSTDNGFDIIATSILPAYLKCVIVIYKAFPDNMNNSSSRITNNLLELFHSCKDFDCYCFSNFIWKWNILIAEHSTPENALNLSCTTFPNVLPRFFPLFEAIVKFIKGYNIYENNVEKLNEEDQLRIEMFKSYLTSASLISHEKSKAHGFAFSLLADGKGIKDALDLAQFDHDCDESDALISFIKDKTDIEKETVH